MVKQYGFGPSRLQELECQLWNCDISNSICTIQQFMETIMMKMQLDINYRLNLAQTLTLSNGDGNS